MTKTYKAFKDMNEMSEYYRTIILGSEGNTGLDTTPSIMDRPSRLQDRPEEGSIADTFQQRLSMWAEPILGEMGRSATDRRALADAILPSEEQDTPMDIYTRDFDLVPLGELLSRNEPEEALGTTRDSEITRSPVPTPRPSREAETSGDLVSRIEDRLVELEGFRGEAYRPVSTEEFLTIGYGHYGESVRPGQTITQEEARELLRQDIQERLPAIRRNIPNYDNLSPELQVEIAQGWFRGDISGSPKTIELINEGRFEEAAAEFLDNEEYRTAVEAGKPGVRPRMEAVSAALRAEARRR